MLENWTSEYQFVLSCYFLNNQAERIKAIEAQIKKSVCVCSHIALLWCPKLTNLTLTLLSGAFTTFCVCLFKICFMSEQRKLEWNPVHHITLLRPNSSLLFSLIHTGHLYMLDFFHQDQKLMGSILGPRHILYPSFTVICSFCVILLMNQPTKQKKYMETSEDVTSWRR